ncbi:MAG: peptide-methionine (S)-S-oxide reductase MsrA [Bacteroidota bacterium]|nr:peptide-methionine (S)-S-oxide reductase MsrA [Bacteroidota bacterium]
MKKINLYLLIFLLTGLLFSCVKNEKQSPDKAKVTDSSKLTKSDTAKSSGILIKATFAAGCFWCVEAVFESIKGVDAVISGYAGGDTKSPTYEEVSSGNTKHAEAVEIYYDSTFVDYNTLLKVFFASQDPTQVNAQGPDTGPQYRSIVFYRTPEEKMLTEKFIMDLNNSGKYKDRIATEVIEFTEFWPAERYHQDYLTNNPAQPYVQSESIPRLKRTQKQFPDLIKPEKSILDK